MSNLVVHASIVRVYDGDTPIANVELPFGTGLINTRVRVNGIDSPELHTPEGDAAAEFAKTLVQTGDTVTLTSPGPLGRRDNYGRVLAAITLPDGRDWAKTMVDAGHATSYTVRALEVGEG